MSNEAITWSAYEYEYRPKTSNWYTVLFVIAIGLSVTAFILGNFLFGVFVIIAAFAIALMGSKPPLSREFSITQRGISINKTFLAWSALDSFWVEEGPAPRLLVRRRDFFAPLIVVPIGDISPELIRTRLGQRLEEEEMAEPLSHRIAEQIGI
jgi:hypothetical protein